MVFSGLKARGNFTVSGVVKEGQMQSASITSVKGGEACVLCRGIHSATVTDENGAETVQKSTFVVDGVELSEESTDFNSFYTNFLNPKANYVIPEDTVVEGEAFLKLRYKRTEPSYPNLVMEYFPLDESFYAVRINGVMMYAVDRRAVDTLMAEINAYVPE